MHFYDFNIGEYAKKTQHLSNEEDLAYRRALDLYYDTEKPLDIGGLATLSRRLRVDEQALKNVLDEFFPGGVNKHAEEKIAAYYAYIEKQRANGKQGGRPKREYKKPTDNPPITQAKPSAKPPLTTNHVDSNSPKSPKGDKTKGIDLKTFLEICREKNEKPISEYKPVFDYADSVGLPSGFIQLAWFEFCRQFGDGGVNSSRKQKDWRKTFRNYVEKGYLKLWWITHEGKYELTTNGRQAQLANSEKLAA